MSKPVKISPEIARLAQRRAVSTGTSLRSELSRMVAEGSILELDPDFGFLVEPDQAFSARDPLVQMLDVNDVVVNGRHIDVRMADSEGFVSMNKMWIGTDYLAAGSLAVRLDPPCSGAVVGWVSPEKWQSAEQAAAETDKVLCQCQPQDFDLAATLQKILNDPHEKPEKPSLKTDHDEIERFATGAPDLSLPRKREIAQAALSDPEVEQKITQAARLWSNQAMAKLLGSASVWNSRLDRVAGQVASRFPNLSKAEVRAITGKIGEAYGGQPEAPAFKKALLSALTREELSRRSVVSSLTNLSAMVEKVFSGQPVAEALSEVVKSKVVVDLAVAIKRQRHKVAGFAAATAEEIGIAFQQLALQPAYATHSQSAEEGLEAVNEALGLLDAGELAKEVAELEDQIG